MAHRPGRPHGQRRSPSTAQLADFMLERWLAACPEAHDHIMYRMVPGRDEPQAFLDLEGYRMHFRWMATEGLMTPAKAEETIVAFEAHIRQLHK